MLNIYPSQRNEVVSANVSFLRCPMIMRERNHGGEGAARSEGSSDAVQERSSHFPPRLVVVLFGILWKLSDAHLVVGVPVGSPYSKDVGTSRLEHTAYELLQRATTNSGIFTDAVSSKMNEMFPKRNLWELISSSSDVIPLRTNFNNGSSHLAQWKSTTKLNSQLSVESRLQKLEHHFNSLRVYDDDCRQRLLCEIAESPAKFSPLTSAFLDETSFNGDEKILASKLLETNDGTRLLTYIEATQRGNSRQGCGIWTYRCPLAASSMIDFKALLVWREISKWLTVKFIAKKHPN